jgi:hypothetical protein
MTETTAMIVKTPMITPSKVKRSGAYWLAGRPRPSLMIHKNIKNLFSFCLNQSSNSTNKFYTILYGEISLKFSLLNYINPERIFLKARFLNLTEKPGKRIILKKELMP